MNNELTCNIVQDLLPNYIEKLTSDETNYAMEQHLASCGKCKEIYGNMTLDIDVEKAPTTELNFLKKVKKTRILAAVITIALTLFLSYFLYTSEYKYTIDKNSLSAGITEFTAPFNSSVDAYVLETKEIDGHLVVSFKDRAKSNINGVAIFDKGLNQRYRIIRARVKPSDYTSVVQIHNINIKDEPYYILSGYNLSDRIMSYGLNYDVYPNPGYLADESIEEIIRFDIVNKQFMEIYSIDDIERFIEDSVDYTYYDARLWKTSLYDADGNDITEDYIIEDNINGPKGSIAKAELFLLNVFIVIVLSVGFFMTRYFLTD